jgi:hypothetical protein
MKPSENSGAAELHSHIEEVIDLQTTFLSLLADAMHDGVDHGYHGKWRGQSFDEHIDHAIMHLLALKYPREGDKENHLEHACFRVVAAGAVEEGALDEENSNDVDRWESEGGAKMGGSEVVGASTRYRFEHGQIVDHTSGLAPRRPGPAPDTYPAAAEPGHFRHYRCGKIHHVSDICEGIL